MRYASWAFVFVNTLLKSGAKIRTFSDAAKFIFGGGGVGTGTGRGGHGYRAGWARVAGTGQGAWLAAVVHGGGGKSCPHLLCCVSGVLRYWPTAAPPLERRSSDFYRTTLGPSPDQDRTKGGGNGVLEAGC